jgi:eukaryotic translation initiation factor 2C
MRIEKETEAAAKLARTKLTSQKIKGRLEPRLPQRPGFGTKGKAVVLWTNYFNMASLVKQMLYRYSIEVVAARGGKSPSGKKFKRVAQLFLDEHFPQYNNGIVTDFKASLLSKTELNFDQAGYQVTYRSEDEDDPAPNAAVYKIRLQPTGTITVSDLMNYLTSAQASQLFSSKDEIIQALNILIGHHPKAANAIASIGANKHFQPAAAATETVSLGAGLIALRGFFVSVRATTARILVNVQVKHGAFFEAGPLEKLINAFGSQNGPSKVKLDSFLKKISIDVIHIVKKNKAGNRVPRIKTIMSLARRDDGRGQSNPPVVSEFGAGSKGVKFFLEDSGPKSSQKSQGKKGKQPAAPTGSGTLSGKYISVYDFFKLSKAPLANLSL